MDKKIKELIDKIGSELKKLESIEDPKVKEVYTSVTSMVTEIMPYVDEIKEKTEEKVEKLEEEVVKAEDKVEDIKEKTEEKIEEIKTEVKEEQKNGEENKDTSNENTESSQIQPSVEEKKDTELSTFDTLTPEEKEKIDTRMSSKNSSVELSLEVADKLKQAALELQNYENILITKDELINVQKNKIMELEKSLNVYKETEKLELAKKFERKVSKLVELYSTLGMKKDAIELKASFSEEQIDKLIIDLSAISPVKQANTPIESKPKRLTPVSVDLELGATKKKEQTEMTTNESSNYLVNEFF